MVSRLSSNPQAALSRGHANIGVSIDNVRKIDLAVRGFGRLNEDWETGFNDVDPGHSISPVAVVITQESVNLKLPELISGSAFEAVPSTAYKREHRGLEIASASRRGFGE